MNTSFSRILQLQSRAELTQTHRPRRLRTNKILSFLRMSKDTDHYNWWARIGYEVDRVRRTFEEVGVLWQEHESDESTDGPKIGTAATAAIRRLQSRNWTLNNRLLCDGVVWLTTSPVAGDISMITWRYLTKNDNIYVSDWNKNNTTITLYNNTHLFCNFTPINAYPTITAMLMQLKIMKNARILDLKHQKMTATMTPTGTASRYDNDWHQWPFSKWASFEKKFVHLFICSKIVQLYY